MKALIGRVLRAFKRILRGFRRGIGSVVTGLSGLLSGQQNGFCETEESEEILDQGVEEKIVEPVEKPAPGASVAQCVKSAVLAIDAGRPIDKVFDLGRHEHVLARDWVASLDDTGIRALRHMPMPALVRHLDPQDHFRGAGLPRFPLVANASTPVAITGVLGSLDFNAAERLQARP